MTSGFRSIPAQNDAGGMPIYKVMAILGKEAVLEDEQHAPLRAPLDRFPWKAAGAA